MLRTFCALLLLCSLSARADKGTSYYDIHWVETKKSEAAYYRIYESVNDSVYSVRDYLMNGKLYRTGYRTSLSSESYKYRTGHFVFYDSSEHKLREGDYEHGRRTGKWNYYYEGSEAVENEYHYIHDTLVGLSYRFDSATHRLKKTTQYENGREVKEWEYDGNDTVQTLTTYADKTTKKTELYQHGVIRKRVYWNYKRDSSFCYDLYNRAVECNNPIKDTSFKYVEKMPDPGYDYNAYLADNITYPKAERKADHEGRVIVKFTVDEDGTVTDVSVNKSGGSNFDEEAVRVVSEFPAWAPGRQNGRIVRVYFMLPIRFKLK